MTSLPSSPLTKEVEPSDSSSGSARLVALDRSLRDQVFAADDLVALSVRAPAVRAERLLALYPREPACFWSEADGQTSVGLGSAKEIVASGRERFEIVRREAESWFAKIRSVGLVTAYRPRFFGGFAFQIGRARGPLWSSFGEAWFVLPRLSYVAEGERSGLSLVVSGAELERAGGRARALAELGEALTHLSKERAPGRSIVHETAQSLAPSFEGSSPEARARFASTVEAARRTIAEGRLSKVVVARRAEVSGVGLASVEGVLARLEDEAPGCTRFLFRRGERAFLGATPERLLRKTGATIETEALAGSIRPSGQAGIDALRQSSKDLEEHAIVVRSLVSALEEHTRSLTYPRAPDVRELRHILHLWTRIKGELKRPAHVLELVEKLHPSPAVGGHPTEQALTWIEDHEADERGWYAAPIGWFDAEGNGDFLVALRSALLDLERAHVYAGSGIVRDSDPDLEFAETEMKLTGILRALGVTM